MSEYKQPEFQEDSFNCPHCNAFAHQAWCGTTYVTPAQVKFDFNELQISICRRCEKYVIWHDGKIIYPYISTISPPNQDLPNDIKKDYLEARDIVFKSPRGAAALLRLCIQKLCIFLGEKGKNLNADIANLVKRGLPEKIQQSLDIVRVVGNYAVHPGQLDIKDDKDIAIKLFELINLIASYMITKPKEVEKLYNSLPESVHKSIQKRDN